MTTKIQATVEDLYLVPENRKAEIIDGELVLMSPTGFWPSRAAGESTGDVASERLWKFPDQGIKTIV